MRHEKEPKVTRAFICLRCGQGGGTLVKVETGGYVHQVCGIAARPARKLRRTYANKGQ